jgi:ABC-type polar amino acid transport system ATPase subunit
MKITIQNLYKAYGKKTVLKDINLKVAQGEVVVFIGKSGSGKSTLLRCINQLELPNEGKITINKFAFDFAKQVCNSDRNLMELRKDVGMVFQQFNLWSHLTVLNNLIVAPINVLKIKKSQAIAQAHQLLNLVALSEKANAYPATLSGGQQQRVAIARALMMQPEIVLFDEPTSALDPEMINEVLQVISKLAKSGMTLLIATHEIDFARQIATQVHFLEGGQLHESGTADILSHPKTPRLKQFLNLMYHNQPGENHEKTYHNNNNSFI